MPINEIIFDGLDSIETQEDKARYLVKYALEFDEETGGLIKPDNKILEFGDTAVIIHNTGEFLRRTCYAMLDRFGNDFWISFQRVEYDVNFSVEQPYDEFCKASSYAYQNEFRIALDLAMGKFNPEILKDVTDFARLTFPGKIEEDTNPDSLTLSIGDIRDISISVPSSDLLKDDFMFPDGLTPPRTILPMRMPREPMPTFFKLAFEQDLVEFEKKVIVSIPEITEDKVNRFLYLVKARQEAGCKVMVITTEPQNIAYNSPEFCQGLIDRMREGGIHVIVKENVEEHFAVLDEELVWHGGMNLLGKEDVWDNLMRVRSAQIAAELLEIALKEE